MARESTEARHARIHAAALKEFDEIQSAQAEEREQCLEDRRFDAIVGAQWEGALGDQFENKPRFEINRVHLSKLRIVNEYRNNRITVDFTAKDGSENDKTADTCDGLYRADERASGREAQDNAFDEGTTGGIGAWRLRSCYEDEDGEEDDRPQRVRFEPIHDADSRVFFDLGAKRQDKSDAKRCYVLVPYTRDDYEAEFGDDPSTWPKGITDTQFDWCTPDVVWVCEQYRVEQKTQMVYWYRPYWVEDDDDESLKRVTQDEIDDDPEMLATLKATGYRVARSKRVKTREIHKYLFSGAGILPCEDGSYRQILPGKHIPIVITYGQRVVIDGVERCMGHVRLAKDAQRLVNSLTSWLADIAARSEMEVPIFTAQQIAGHAAMWSEHNIKRFPFLLVNPMKDKDGNILPAAQLGYTKSPSVPPAMAALTQFAYQALTDMLGAQEAGEEMQPNLSGKAVELIQQRLDMQTFIYVDNFAQYAVRHSGVIWLSMMKDIVVEESRRMKTVASDGKAGSVVVNEPRVKKDTSEKYLENDLSKATFDVDVDVGPSSNSKRAATVRALSGLASITDDPETKQILTFAILQNMEGEGLSDVSAHGRRRLIRMGVVKPNDEEAKELAQEQANKQPDPQAAYLMAEADKSKADTLVSLTEAGLKEAQTEKARAEAAKAIAQIGTEQANTAIAIADALAPPVQPGA